MATLQKDKRTAYLKKCRNRISAARKFRKEEHLDDTWNRLIDLYRGKHFEKIAQEDRIAVNVVFSNVNTIWASISTNYPKISVNARMPEEQDSAIITEATVNYWWRHKEFRKEIQLAQKESLIIGHGWVKTGWRFVEEQQKRSQQDMSAEYDQRIQQVNDYATQSPENAAGLPTNEEIQAMIPDSELVCVEDSPFVERVSPFDMLVDPEATSLRDAKWIAQCIYKPLREVQGNKDYKSNVRGQLKADQSLDESMRPTGVKKGDPDYQRCSVYEYYDLKDGTMCIFAESGEDFLVDPVPQPYSFGHPFVMVANYEIPGRFYPIGEVEAIEDLQNELNKTRSQMLNHRKRGARKFLYDKRAFSNRAVQDLVSDIDGVAVPVNDGIALNEAIIPLPTIAIDPQLYQWSEQIEADINSIGGVSEYQRGGSAQSIRRSATEASIIADAANSRASEKLSRFELVNADVARRVVMLAQQYMTKDQAIRITGPNGAPVWGNVEPDFIKGEFDYEVESGSTKPKNEAYLMNQAMQMFQALAPIIPTGVLNLPEIVKFFLEQGFGIKDGSKFVAQQGPQVDPQTGQPMGGPPGMPPQGPQGPSPQGPPPAQGAQAPQGSDIQGVPHDILTQLMGQVNFPQGGVTPPNG